MIHHIRLLLTMHPPADLKDLITAQCKIMGPQVPIFRRDMSMPFWWTLDMDIDLLRLILIHGCGNWKKFLVEPLLAGPSVETMQIPPKVNGKHRLRRSACVHFVRARVLMPAGLVQVSIGFSS